MTDEIPNIFRGNCLTYADGVRDLEWVRDFLNYTIERYPRIRSKDMDIIGHALLRAKADGILEAVDQFTTFIKQLHASEKSKEYTVKDMQITNAALRAIITQHIWSKNQVDEDRNRINAME